MPPVLPLAWRLVYARYLLASAAALAVDLAAFLILLDVSVRPVIAATAGYGLGLCLHWLMSSRLVFHDAPDPTDGWRRKALFAASAVAGLGLTALVVAVFDRIGLDPRLGKAMAVVASFHLVYLIRRHIVFR